MFEKTEWSVLSCNKNIRCIVDGGGYLELKPNSGKMRIPLPEK